MADDERSSATTRDTFVEYNQRRFKRAHLPLAALIACLLAIAVAYASAFVPGGAPGWAAWLFAFAAPGSMIAAMALGAAKDGRVGRLRWPFALAFVVVAGGFALALALPAEDAADPRLLLGLPLRAAVVVYGIGLLPFLLVPLAYALTFDEQTLGEADLRRVRDLARRADRDVSAETSMPHKSRSAPSGPDEATRAGAATPPDTQPSPEAEREPGDRGAT